VQFEAHFTEKECNKQYRKAFRRAPETVVAPEASNTPWWWFGYVTLDEQTRFNDERQLRFDFFGQRVVRTRKKRGGEASSEATLFNQPE
jgi:hypothetical protein